MTYRSVVSPDVFTRIARGDQIIEPRLYDPAHRAIKIGDMVLFINRATSHEVLTKVVGLLKFGSFVELFNAYPASRFGASNDQELVRSMRALYTPEQEIAHGVVGVKLHVLRAKP